MTFLAFAGWCCPAVRIVLALPAGLPDVAAPNRSLSMSDASASPPRPMPHWLKSCRRVVPRSWCSLRSMSSLPGDRLVEVQQNAGHDRPRGEIRLRHSVRRLVFPEQRPCPRRVFRECGLLGSEQVDERLPLLDRGDAGGAEL